jgi:replication factor A1
MASAHLQVCLPVRYPVLTIRYILQINLMDHAGQMWITAFNEVAEQMMGISANDLHAMKDEGNEVEFNKYFQNVVGKTFTFQMMAKQDTYQVSLSRVLMTCPCPVLT